MSLRPNILMIMTDQHRFDYLRCAGANWLETPGIDALAARGVRFTHAFTNSPICAPARSAFATGLQPHRTGVMSNGDTIGLSQPTLYQRLQRHQYWTGYVGKLDLVKPIEHPRPGGRSPIAMALGFCDPRDVMPNYDAYLEEKGLLETAKADRRSRVPFPGMHGVLALRPTPVSRAVVRPDGWVREVSKDSPLCAEDHKDAYTGRWAARWIAEASEEYPWFYQVNFGGPHDPFDPPAEIAQRYRQAAVPDPVPTNFAGKPEGSKYRFITDDEDDIRFTRRQYSASIALLDQEVGRIMAAVEARGQADNTYVIFCSDHGEMLGDHGFYTKHVPYEAAIRIPMIIAGPGIDRGRTSDAMVELIDLHATIADWAGLRPVENTDARSLAPLLTGETDDHREHILTQESHFACVRDRRYKFVLNHNDIDELYDLQADPMEQHNLALSEYCDIDLFRRMRRLLTQRLTEGSWHR